VHEISREPLLHSYESNVMQLAVPLPPPLDPPLWS
jgi:hypothetical protein